MDKINLEYTTPENRTIKYKGVDIEIIPWLSLAQQAYLVESYIKDYFSNPEAILIENTRYHYLEAKCQLKSNVIQLNTNINLTQENLNAILEDYVLWYAITEQIENWGDFMNILETTVCNVKQQETLENSVGKIINDLVEKGYSLLDKLASLNPEELKKAGEEGQKLIDRLEKSSILNNPQDKVVIAENAGLVEVENKVIEKATQIKTRKPRAKKAK